MIKTAGLMWTLPMMSWPGVARGFDATSPIYSRGQGPGLREIAGKKLHHGEERFINPFSPSSPRSLKRLLTWKLFSKNHFKPLYDREQVRPVTIDWEPVRRHPGVSVTFLKHAGLLIKDVDAYLLVDPVFFDLLWFIRDFSPFAFDAKEIPQPSHVLITHGPPQGHGGLTSRGVEAGCEELLAAVEQRVRPAYHVFGHIHEGYGVTTNGATTFVNASVCTLSYAPTNAPVVFEVAVPAVPAEP